MNNDLKRLLSILLALVVAIATWGYYPAVAQASGLIKINYWGMVSCWGTGRGSPFGEATTYLTVWPANEGIGTITGLRWKYGYRDENGVAVSREIRRGFSNSFTVQIGSTEPITFTTKAPPEMKTPTAVTPVYVKVSGWPDGPLNGARVVDGDMWLIAGLGVPNLTQEFECTYLDELPQEYPKAVPVPAGSSPTQEPPPFTGGQCPGVPYSYEIRGTWGRVTLNRATGEYYEFESANDAMQRSIFRTATADGPISVRIVNEMGGTNFHDPPIRYHQSLGVYSGDDPAPHPLFPGQDFKLSSYVNGQVGFPGIMPSHDYEIRNVTRVDGLPDGCGDPGAYQQVQSMFLKHINQSDDDCFEQPFPGDTPPRIDPGSLRFFSETTASDGPLEFQWKAGIEYTTNGVDQRMVFAEDNSTNNPGAGSFDLCGPGIRFATKGGN